MYQYRITKYNPSNRDASGAYKIDEWTSYAEIGKTFCGVRLTSENYRPVEGAYVLVAEAFLHESGVSDLAVTGLESNRGCAPVSEGQRVSVAQVGGVLRALLREQYWCRLERMGAFVHVGRDYYMYIGVPSECPSAEAAAKAHNLYVERFVSPYTNSTA